MSKLCDAFSHNYWKLVKKELMSEVTDCHLHFRNWICEVKDSEELRVNVRGRRGEEEDGPLFRLDLSPVSLSLPPRCHRATWRYQITSQHLHTPTFFSFLVLVVHSQSSIRRLRRGRAQWTLRASSLSLHTWIGTWGRNQLSSTFSADLSAVALQPSARLVQRSSSELSVGLSNPSPGYWTLVSCAIGGPSANRKLHSLHPQSDVE